MRPACNNNLDGRPQTGNACPGREDLPIAAVLMAAGISARYGAANKLLAVYGGKPLILRAADAAAAWPFAQRIAIVRDPQAAELLEHGAAAFEIVPNTGEDLSVRRTVRLAVEALDASCAGALFCVCDQPLLSAGTVARICETFLEDPTRIVTLSWQGKRGNPVLFPRSVFPELLALGENEAGRAVLKRHPELVKQVEAAGEEELFDIDTAQQMADLTQLHQM